jgi:predicted nucleic acid-binding protein
MTPVFADTAFYVAILNPRDALHSAAVRLSQTNRSPVLTTEFILLEVANFFTRPGERDEFVRFMAALANDATTEILPCSSQLFRAGYALFEERPDKEWSLTDCTSFVAMTDRGLSDALTSDHHFTQAGFRVLLPPDPG